MSGRVLRQIGEQVIADTLVAEADTPMGYRLFDLEKEMRLTVRDVRKILTKKRDEPFERGDVIARTGWWRKTEYAAPVDGKIIDARGSQILIQVQEQHIDLPALYPGRITQIMPDVGVTIELAGAIIQGVWGCGAERYARLQQTAPDGETPLQPEQIVASFIGGILIGGRTLDEAALAQIVQVQASAVIVGSLSTRLLPLIEQTGLSVLLTEGLGDMPMNPRTFDLLSKMAGREACLNPTGSTQGEGRRPEIVVPLPAERSPIQAADTATLQVGSRVRALCMPYQNQIGQVTALPRAPRRIESDVWARGAVVSFAPTQKEFIPLANLELIQDGGGI